MVEMELEEKIVDAVKALGVEGLAVKGLWQTASSGDLKGLEDAAAPAAAAVMVGPKSFDRYGICEASFDCAIALAVRMDLDASGRILAHAAAAVSDLLQRWNLVESGDGLADLATRGGFAPGGVQLSGGSGPTLADGAWAATWDFTVRGTVPHVVDNEEARSGNGVQGQG